MGFQATFSHIHLLEKNGNFGNEKATILGMEKYSFRNEKTCTSGNEKNLYLGNEKHFWRNSAGLAGADFQAAKPSPSLLNPGIASPYLQVDHPGHDQRGHQQVCHGQADDQVVGGGLQGSLPGHCHAHQDVAKDDDEDEEGEQHGVVVVVRLVRRVRRVQGPAPVPVPVVPREVEGIHGGPSARCQLHPGAEVLERPLEVSMENKHGTIRLVLPRLWDSLEPVLPALGEKFGWKWDAELIQAGIPEVGFYFQLTPRFLWQLLCVIVGSGKVLGVFVP